MKSIKISILVLFAIGIIAFNMTLERYNKDLQDMQLENLINQAVASDSENMEYNGYWVFVYNGHTTPQYAQCVPSYFHSLDCIVGEKHPNYPKP